jgi:regulator of cell morphogenesis and NO signaling
MLIQKEHTIGDVVSKNFKTARIFEDFGLDFCCGGRKTISEACREKGIDLEKVLNALSQLGENGSSQINGANKWSLDFLADYIVNKHHSYVSQSLPVISEKAKKVADVHGEHHPETKDIYSLFMNVSEELQSHMMKEERMLFPYIKELVESQKQNNPVYYPPFGMVANPISVMEAEHDSAGNTLKEISRLSNKYTAPEDACETFKVLYKELREFEDDLHVHIHLENNILFPKAIELEKELNKNL